MSADPLTLDQQLQDQQDARRLLTLFSWLESEEAKQALDVLERRSPSQLLKLLVGADADTKQLLFAPEESKYPLECSRIKSVGLLRTLGRVVSRTRKVKEAELGW